MSPRRAFNADTTSSPTCPPSMRGGFEKNSDTPYGVSGTRYITGLKGSLWFTTFANVYKWDLNTFRSILYHCPWFHICRTGTGTGTGTRPATSVLIFMTSCTCVRSGILAVSEHGLHHTLNDFSTGSNMLTSPDPTLTWLSLAFFHHQYRGNKWLARFGS